jgi:hypothetical protein
LRPRGRSHRTMCSRSGAEAEAAPSVAGSSGPRETASRAIAKTPLRISKRRSSMSSCGTRSHARCSGGPRASAATRERVSAPSAAPVATWRETITTQGLHRPRAVVGRFEAGAQRIMSVEHSPRPSRASACRGRNCGRKRATTTDHCRPTSGAVKPLETAKNGQTQSAVVTRQAGGRWFEPSTAHLAAVRELPKTCVLLTMSLTAVTTEQHDIACDENSSGV